MQSICIYIYVRLHLFHQHEFHGSARMNWTMGAGGCWCYMLQICNSGWRNLEQGMAAKQGSCSIKERQLHDP